MNFRVVEGAILNQGTVSGTDATPFSLTEATHALRIYIENPSTCPDVNVFNGPFTVINSTASGQVTITGAGNVEVFTDGDIITISGSGSGSGVDSLNSVTGDITLNGADGNIVLTNGQVITVSGFRSEFVSASGSLQNQINNITGDEVEPAIVGFDGITVVSGASTTALTGFYTEFVSASGSLQNQIDNKNIDEVEPALVGVDGITIISGTSTTTVSGFYTEFTTASGFLQTQIDSIDSSVTLQDAYDNGTGIIATTVSKPVTVTGSSGVLVQGPLTVTGILVATTGTFSSGITIGSATTTLTTNGIVAPDGVFTNSLTLRGLPVLTSVDIPALVGTDGITIISGSSTTTIDGFYGEFTTASGYFQTQINNFNADEIEPALIGLDGITVVSGVSTTAISGFYGEFTTASGFLQTQIDTKNIDEIEPALVGVDGITIISGTNITTISGFRAEALAASGSLQNQINNLDSIYATDAHLISVSGHLQSQISSIVADEIEPAITGSDGVTITSGTSTTNVAGFYSEFTTASGFLQTQIDTKNIDEVEPAIVGLDGITVVSGVSTTALSGFYTEFTTASGYLQDQINSVDIDEVEPALVGVDGITIISGTNITTVSGFRAEFLSASGSLQTNIDNVTLQDAYDNGDGAIITLEAKPVLISGSGGVTISGTTYTTDLRALGGHPAELPDIPRNRPVATVGSVDYPYSSLVLAASGVSYHGEVIRLLGTQDLGPNTPPTDYTLRMGGGPGVTTLKMDKGGSNTFNIDLGNSNSGHSFSVIGRNTLGTTEDVLSVGGLGTGTIQIAGTDVMIMQATQFLITGNDVLSFTANGPASSITFDGAAGGTTLSFNNTQVDMDMRFYGFQSSATSLYIDANAFDTTLGPFDNRASFLFGGVGEGQSRAFVSIEAYSILTSGIDFAALQVDTSLLTIRTGQKINYLDSLFVPIGTIELESVAASGNNFTSVRIEGPPGGSAVPVLAKRALWVQSGIAQFDGALVAASGSFSSVLTVSGFPVLIHREVPPALIGADGITIISGSNTTTIDGFYGEFTTASGYFQTQINNFNADEIEPAIIGLDGITVVSGVSTTAISGFYGEFTTASGYLQNQIDTKNIDEIEPAIVGGFGITVASGAAATAISVDTAVIATDAEVTTISGHLQNQIDTKNIDEIEPAIIGANGITVTSGTATTTVTGFYNEFTTASGFLQVQIATKNIDEIEPAIVGSDGITVTSGTDITTIAGFYSEFTSASGILQTQIDAIDDSVTLQDAYNNGDGIILTTALKPVVVTGTANPSLRVFRDARVEGQVTASGGSVAGPGFAFNGNTNYGMFLDVNELSFTSEGVKKFAIETDGTLRSTTNNYENLVLSNNDMTNKRYVDNTVVAASGFLQGQIDAGTLQDAYDQGTGVILTSAATKHVVVTGTGGFLVRGPTVISGSLTLDGQVLPVPTSTINLGSTTRRFATLSANRGQFFAGNGTLTLGANATGPLFGASTDVTGAGTAEFRINNLTAFSAASVSSYAGGTARARSMTAAAVVLGRVGNYGGGTALLDGYGIGSLTGGSSYAYYGTATLTSVGTGSFSWGSAYSTLGGTITLGSTATGAFTAGYGGGAGTVRVRARGRGSFVQGYASAASGRTAVVETSDLTGIGAFAQGRALASTGNAYILSGSSGSFAQGAARVSAGTATATILANAYGAFAQGFARSTGSTSLIQATAQGAFAVGYAQNTTIAATAINAAQFGPGTNAYANSLKVGTAGLRFRGTSSAGTAPSVVNGDFWVNSSGNHVQLQTGGFVTNLTDWRVRATQNTFNLTFNAHTAITFNTEAFDQGPVAWHDNVTNNDQFRVPGSGAGLYHLAASALFDESTAGAGANLGQRGLRFTVGGSATDLAGDMREAPSVTEDTRISISDIVYLHDGNIVRVEAFANAVAGTAIDLDAQVTIKKAV